MLTEITSGCDTQARDPPVSCSDCLYCQYHSRIYRHLAARTRSMSLADDLAQDTLLQAMRRMHGFEGRGSLVNWLLAIANYVYNRHLAREKRLRQVLECRFAESAGHCLHEEDAGKGMAEAIKDLNMELAALPPSLRLPLELTALRYCGYVEAAAVLGIEVTTLRMRIHRAKKILAKRLCRHRDLF